MEEILIGVTDRTILVFIGDPTSTAGAGMTGLVAADLTGSYTRVETDNDVAVVDVTGSLNDLASLTAAHADWGWFEVSATVAPGLYRLDLADAVFAAGAWYAVVQITLTSGLASATPKAFQLVAFNALDGVRLGLTALPNAAAQADGGLYTRGTGAGQLSQATNGELGAVTVVQSLSTAAILSVWNQLTAALSTASTIGKLIVDNLNATVSSRATPADVAAAVAGLATPADVNAQVLDVLNVDTFGEPTGVPPATTTLVQKIGRLHMALRNGVTVDSNTGKKQFLDDGNAAEWEKDFTDAGGIYSETKANSV